MTRALTIGLEIHIKLKSKTKMFCQCQNQQNFETLLPNTHVCPICMWQPGALPTLTQDALWKSLLIGKALNCTINKVSTFDRKSYFYPDLPMWYQITQLYHPTNTNGRVSFFLNNFSEEKSVGILDAHLECDTAKMIHNGGEAMIDFNRAGTPLVEVVTGPDFSSTDEVVEFLKELQRIVRYNDIADADLEKGQMRVDVNISLRPSLDTPLGTRVELKNLNSFSAIRRAIENEEARQMKLYDNNQVFSQQTRRRDDSKWESFLMRSKEDALDYRYFPEPDLPALVLDEELLTRIQKTPLEIPYNIIKTFKEEYGFNKEFINGLIWDKLVLDYFLARKNIDPRTAAKWICGPIAARRTENFTEISDLAFTAEQFDTFLQIAAKGEILESQLKLIMEDMIATGRDAETIIKEKWFDAPAIDTESINQIIDKVLADNQSIVEQYKWGKTTTLGFFVGQVMKQTWWKINPQTAAKLVEEKLTQ